MHLPTKKLSKLCLFWVFMEASLYRHGQLDHWPLVIELNLYPLLLFPKGSVLTPWTLVSLRCPNDNSYLFALLRSSVITVILYIARVERKHLFILAYGSVENKKLILDLMERTPHSLKISDFQMCVGDEWGLEVWVYLILFSFLLPSVL